MKIRRLEGGHGRWFLFFAVLGIVLSSYCVQEDITINVSAWVFLFTLANFAGFVVAKW